MRSATYGISRLDGALRVLGDFSITVARKVGEVADVLALAVLRLNAPSDNTKRRRVAGKENRDWRRFKASEWRVMIGGWSNVIGV